MVQALPARTAWTLPTIISVLERWKRAHKPYDRIASLAWFRFTMEKDKKVVLRRLSKQAGMPKRLLLSQHALDQLLARLRYPKELYEALPNKLNRQNLNYLMQHKPYSKKKMRLRIIDRNTVRAVLSDRFRPFDNIRLVRLLMPQLGSVSVNWYFNAEMILHISVLYQQQIQTNVAGIVQQGIHVSNSEVGVRSVTVASYVYRFVCENGLIGVEIQRFWHVGNLRRLRGDIVGAVKTARDGAADITRQFSAAASKDVIRPKAFIRKILEDRGLSLGLFSVVFSALPTHMQSRTNQFELSQAFARAANSFNGDRAYELRQAAVYVLGV